MSNERQDEYEEYPTMHLRPATRSDFAFELFSADKKFVVGYKHDGTLEFGEGYTPTTAAKEFWDAFGRFSNQEIVEMEHQMETLRKKLERAHKQTIQRGLNWGK